MKTNRDREHPLNRLKQQRRRVYVKENSNRQVVAGFLLCFLAGIAFSPVVAQAVDQQTSIHQPPSFEMLKSESSTVTVNGFTYRFVNENHSGFQEHTIGLTYSNLDDEVLLKKNMTPYQLYTTCVHERLHEKGVMGSEDHDWIRQVEDEVVDRNCIRLVALRK